MRRRKRHETRAENLSIIVRLSNPNPRNAELILYYITRELGALIPHKFPKELSPAIVCKCPRVECVDKNVRLENINACPLRT